MNYFAHAWHFLDDPYFVAGTAVPDWLSVSDRQVRLRSRHVAAAVDDADPRVAAVARGVLQHIRDDARFHATRAFAESSLALTVLVRDALGAETGFRPSFLGHLLVEVLLDAVLIDESPERLEAYYRALATVDVRLVQAAVNRFAPRPAKRLAIMAARFLAGADLVGLRRGCQTDGTAQPGDAPRGVPGVARPFPGRPGPRRRLVAGRRGELLQGIPAAENDSPLATNHTLL